MVLKSQQKKLTFDKELILEKGCSLETPVLITNVDDVADLIETEKDTVESGDELLTVIF